MIQRMDPRALAAESGREDDERFRRMTPDERLAIFIELYQLTDSIVRNRPDADRLRSPTPRSAESEALWQELIARARRERERA
jgi:hypothetical protein